MSAVAPEFQNALPRSEPIWQSRALWLALYAVLLLLRLPEVVLHGRFFSEEGQYFFGYAWHMPAWATLARSFGGYGNLIANAAALMAKTAVVAGGVPLEDAPYVTEAVGFLFQLAPALVIVSARAKWLRPVWAAPLALFFMATTPGVEETGLHTLHSQFYLALAAVIILNTEPATATAARALRLVCLLLAPLAGPLAMALVPAFALIWLIERSRGRAWETASLALGAALQLAIFWAPDAARRNAFDLVMFVNAFVWRNDVLPFAGPRISDLLAEHSIVALRSPGWSEAKAATLTLDAVGMLATLGLAVFALRHWREASARFLLLGLGLSALSFYGAVNANAWMALSTNGQHYELVPHALFGLAALAAVATGETPRRLFPATALLLMLAASALEFAEPKPDFLTGPDWAREVQKWRADPHYRPAVWMAGLPAQFSMRVDLGPAREDCAQPDAVASYCNQAWDRLQSELLAGGVPHFRF